MHKALENKCGRLDPAKVPLETQRGKDNEVMTMLWDHMKNLCGEGVPIEEILLANRHRTTALFYVLLARHYDPETEELIDPRNVEKLGRNMPVPERRCSLLASL